MRWSTAAIKRTCSIRGVLLCSSDRAQEARLPDRKSNSDHAVTWRSREPRRRRDRMRQCTRAVAPARAARPAHQHYVTRLLVGDRRQRRLLPPDFRSTVAVGFRIARGKELHSTRR